MGIPSGFNRFFSCFSARSTGGATAPDDSDGEDIISTLPDDVLSGIVSLLPVKDAARTAALSSLWRDLWASNPLVLDDMDLLLGNPRHVAAVTATVSHAIAAHKGPFRSLSLTCYFAAADKHVLRRWIRTLAARGVTDLVLNNIPWAGLNLLPSALLECRSLQRLRISDWRFPDTSATAAAVLRRGEAAALPCLRELVLSRTIIREQDLDCVVASSPRLKTLVFVLSFGVPARVCVSSWSLSCVVFWHSVAEELAVAAVPMLERVIIQMSPLLSCGVGRDGGDRMRIKISSASMVQVLGYLNPNCHELQIGDTVIKVGKKVVPDAMVPSVKILALSVQFGVRNRRMVFRFLQCFPNIETLHIGSIPDRGPTTKNGDSEFWNEMRSVECVKASINTVVIHGFRWENCEIEFLKSILEGGKMLQKICILQDENISVSDSDINGILSLLASLNKGVEMMILAGQDYGIWTYEVASDLSRNDPFDCQS
ncbi:unnamed protein product [Urochloa humidicola]